MIGIRGIGIENPHHGIWRVGKGRPESRLPEIFGGDKRGGERIWLLIIGLCDGDLDRPVNRSFGSPKTRLNGPP